VRAVSYIEVINGHAYVFCLHKTLLLNLITLTAINKPPNFTPHFPPKENKNKKKKQHKKQEYELDKLKTTLTSMISYV